MSAPILAAVLMASALEFRDPRLTIPETAAPPSAILLHEPLIPGTGEGNALSWADLGMADPPATRQVEDAAWNALTAYLDSTDALRIERDELGAPRVTVHDGGQLVQIWVPRAFGGVPVRDSALTAVINHGNLVLLGVRRWARRPRPDARSIDAAAAQRVVSAYLRGKTLEGAAPRLEYVAVASDAEAHGYGFRAVWVIAGHLAGDHASWEALVDATSGALLAFEDRNLYAHSTRIVGGVYPLGNDGVPPDGIEQPGYPMPFADVRLARRTAFTNSNGLVCLPGPGLGDAALPAETRLSGRYVAINDACGPIAEPFLTGSETPVDLGFGPGTDCTVPPGHSAGDTHAARTAFYEMNRINEQARGYLPANAWLGTAVTANTNVNPSCGAFWNGSAVTLYRSSATCRNAGEIAGVVDHEWGHGMDQNGANPTISNPSEAIADIHAALRHDASCVGRGFLQTAMCLGYGDPCTSCNGLRDLDWARHQSGQPHDIAWVQSRCPIDNSICNRQVHCAGTPLAEALWDLHARDLPAQFGLDRSSALEIATRLVYLGGGLVSTWFQCTPPFGGCSATGGYLNLLAADDDNGNLLDGTPHASAVFAAFNRHQIACATPAPTNSGCAAGPAAAPALTATPQDQRVTLSWTAVPGATRYAIYRADGVRGCEAGKAKVGETAGTSFTDQGLLNGFQYHYAVLPLAANSACFGPMSACQTAVPSGSGLCAP